MTGEGAAHRSGEQTGLGPFLGFDIGGTKTAVILATATGEILERVEVPTRPDEGFEPAFGRICAAADDVTARARQAGVRPSHAGVSIGGPLDVESGIIYSPPNLPGWDGIPLKELLAAHTGLPVIVEHDGVAGALAEHRFGAGRGARHLIFLTMGTGLGAGFILNGVPYRGLGEAGSSVGHIRMAEEGPVAWGKSGSWEAFSSGAGIAALARLRYPDSFSQGVTAKEVAGRAAHGDAQAEAVLRESAQYLGKGIALLIDIFNPEMVVLGSLAARLGDRLLGPAVEMIEREAEPKARQGCRIVPSALGDRLGDLAPIAALLTRLENGDEEGFRRPQGVDFFNDAHKD